MPAKCATTTARLATCVHDIVIYHTVRPSSASWNAQCVSHIAKSSTCLKIRRHVMARLIAFLDKMLTLARHPSKLSFGSLNRIFSHIAKSLTCLKIHRHVMARLIAFLDKMLTLARHPSKLSFGSLNRIFRTTDN